MFFWKSNRKKSFTICQKRLRLEQLEDKRLLAIVWANEFGTTAAGNDPNFGVFNTNEVVARTIVNRAIDDWEGVITDFNYDNDNNPNTVNLLNDTYSLNISAGPIAGRGATGINTFAPNGNAGTGNRPASATITLDDNGGGRGSVRSTY